MNRSGQGSGNTGYKTSRKLLIAAVVVSGVILFRVFNLSDYLTIESIRASQQRFAAMYARHPVCVIAAYAGVYILVTSLSLPGAAVLTLAGGALFGLTTGTIVVSFVSSAGATIACGVSRYLLRDWVQRRFGERLQTVNAGVEKEGAFYLFGLRLIPVIPFWLINLVMGLTRMPLRTFYWVSQIGMLPATAVYVNAGRKLSKIHSISEILAPGVIFSFALLGLFPITARKLLSLLRSSWENKHR